MGQVAQIQTTQRLSIEIFIVQVGVAVTRRLRKIAIIKMAGTVVEMLDVALTMIPLPNTEIIT